MTCMGLETLACHLVPIWHVTGQVSSLMELTRSAKDALGQTECERLCCSSLIPQVNRACLLQDTCPAQDGHLLGEVVDHAGARQDAGCMNTRKALVRTRTGP